MQPKLTISVLISRNYDGVKKCLNSVRPIIDKVPSELILTDTGCGDEVRELIEGYSDHIIDFEWIKDFSAARNAGLKEAKGEWFLFVDDDEWFEDVAEIVEFFNSNECDKYNVACYIQRNYRDWDGKEYIDHNVDRIIRITPELHFEHRVHETYTGVEIDKKKILNSYVHHYGYVFKSKEDNISRFNRNYELLMLEIKDNPTDMRLRHQLVKNFLPTEQIDESIKESFEAIKIESESEYWDAIHNNILFCYQFKKDWDSVIKYGEQFLDKKLLPYDGFGVHQYLIRAYWEKEDYDNVCRLGEKAIHIYIDYKNHPDDYNEQQLMRFEFWSSNNISEMLCYILSGTLHTKDRKSLESLNNNQIRDDVLFLVRDENYKTWVMTMVFGACEDDSYIQLFEQLPFCKEIWSTDIDKYINQLDLIMPYIDAEKFAIWETWLLNHVIEGSIKEMYCFSKICDYRLSNIKYYNMDKTEQESIEYILSTMSGYAETRIYYCELKYGDKLDAMGPEDLLEEEYLAWIIQDMMSSFDNSNVAETISLIKKIIDIRKQWADALGEITTYIARLVEG